MEQPRVQRKLAAIMVADVVGYSRLVRADEEGTLAHLKAIRQELIDPSIAAHYGTIVKSTGDGVLVEFPSVVEAVRHAAEVQEGVMERNQGLPEDRHIRFRVGINLGDVVIEGDDILGDGVNVAARLEKLAEPGSICISDDAYRQIRDKLDLAFEDLGEHKVKNIARPIHIWQLNVKSEAAPAAAAKSATAAPADKPSIAVLPFDNMSGDAEQEFFTDGITEDIITELSRFRELIVISRTSTFAFKGKQVTVQEVAKELAVQFVVEGSVRKAGNRVRVTVQLIDADTGRHVWAERYDRDLEDIFALQDEVTQTIVAILPGRIEAATRERAERKTPENMLAYEYVLAGKRLHHRSTPKDNAEALNMLDRAIALDPNYAHAHAWKACTLGQAWGHGYFGDPDELKSQIVEELNTALALDDNDSDVHRILAAVNLVYEDFDKAMYHQERALSLNPNDDLVVVQQGEVLTWLGRPEEGIEWIRKAMRLNPYHPERFWNHLGRAYFVAKRYGEAIDAFNRITAPNDTHHAFLAACHTRLGDEGAARRHAAKVLQLNPDFTVATYMTTLHYKQDGDREHHRESLIEAGLPE